MRRNHIRICHLTRGFVLLARVGLGCLFLYSALPKIRQPYDFLHDVYNYEIVGPKLGLLVAMTLPWMELLVGICLLGGIFVSGAFLVCMGMAAMFTFVITWALYQGLDISCGCFGSGTAKITYLTLIRALLILLFSAAAYLSVVFSAPRDTQEVRDFAGASI
jgi:putative oxidoreductase